MQLASPNMTEIFNHKSWKPIYLWSEARLKVKVTRHKLKKVCVGLQTEHNINASCVRQPSWVFPAPMLLPTAGFSVRGVLVSSKKKNTAGVDRGALVSARFFWFRLCRNIDNTVSISPANARWRQCELFIAWRATLYALHGTGAAAAATRKHYHKSTSLGNTAVGSCCRQRATTLDRDLHSYRRRLTAFRDAVRRRSFFQSARSRNTVRSSVPEGLVRYAPT